MVSPKHHVPCRAHPNGGAPGLSRSPSKASGLGSGSVHGGAGAEPSGNSLKRSLTKTKSIRKGLARGSMALLDDVTAAHAEASTTLSRVPSRAPK